MTGQPVLSLKEVSKSFRDVAALRSVTLEVREGDFLGLVGPNGAGKTTLIRVALGLLRPDSGVVRLMGLDPFKEPDARARVGVIFERPNLPPSMPVVEILQRAARIYRASYQDVRKVVEIAGLEGHELKPFGHLSAGLKQRAAIAHALISNPALIIADEPTSNLDPIERHEVLSLLARLNKSGVTVVLSSHVLSEVLRVVTKVAIIKGGSIVTIGAPDEVTAGARVGRIRTPDPDWLAKLFAERGFDVKVEEQSVYVTLRARSEERDLLLALADAIAKGVKYYGLDLVEPGIEEVLK